MGQIKSVVPGLAETLPEKEIPTRAGPAMQVKPLMRFAGLQTNDPLNRGERELARLNFKPQDIMPRTGDHQFDELHARFMGPILEKVLDHVVKTEKWHNLAVPDQV